MITSSEADHRLAVLHEGFIFEFSVNGLSQPEAVYLVLIRFHMEVHNGGITQFFLNCGQFSPYLLDALKAVGADEMSGFAEKAIAAVDTDMNWNDDQVRWRRIKLLDKKTSDHLWDIGGEIIKLLDDLSIKLFKYVSLHRTHFDMPDDFWREDTLQ